jgi:amidase
VPLADGSDLGGSLRNPASFCNVVGLRPSEGRVPNPAALDGWAQLNVLGPMARTVGDAALLLSAIAGPHPLAPASLETPGAAFGVPLEGEVRGARVAWCMHPGGIPVEPEVLAALEPALAAFATLGWEVEEAGPDFEGADFAFRTMRAWATNAARGDLVRRHPELVKETVRQEVEAGARVTGEQLAEAGFARTRVFRSMARFMERYDLLALPAAQVPPFPVSVEYPAEVAGERMDSYIGWMRACYYVTVTGHPAISLPCGFTADGLPVGLQLVGRYRQELPLLRLANAFEAVTGTGQRRPPLISA